MANMSYCRFENTKKDVRDCIDMLAERNISSNSERRSAKQMLQSILNYCQEEGIIQDYDSTRLIEVIEECKNQGDNQ